VQAGCIQELCGGLLVPAAGVMRALLARVADMWGCSWEDVLCSHAVLLTAVHVCVCLCVCACRARLGLYVFGRQSLFANCFELQPAFSTLLARPTQVGWAEEMFCDMRVAGLVPVCMCVC
jgi:hypothetical protein